MLIELILIQSLHRIPNNIVAAEITNTGRKDNPILRVDRCYYVDENGDTQIRYCKDNSTGPKKTIKKNLEKKK